MKVSYQYTKEDLKKFLISSRKVNNIILFIVGITIYLFLTINKVKLIWLPIVIVLLILVIYLLNKLYVALYIKVNEMLNTNVCGKYILELTPNKFSLSINGAKVDYKYSNIRKVKLNKNSFTISFQKSRDSLIFEKRLFKDNEYEKVIEMFKEKSCK